MRAAAKQVYSKTRSNHRTKMASYEKRARRGMLGFTIGWTDENPNEASIDESEIKHTFVTHKNPTQKLVCLDMWKRCSDWILKTEFTWLLTVTVVYDSHNRASADEKRDIAEFTLTSAFRKPGETRLADAADDFILESRLSNGMLDANHKNYGVFKHVEFRAEIVGV